VRTYRDDNCLVVRLATMAREFRRKYFRTSLNHFLQPKHWDEGRDSGSIPRSES
jgi:hypothetical protein